MDRPAHHQVEGLHHARQRLQEGSLRLPCFPHRGARDRALQPVQQCACLAVQKRLELLQRSCPPPEDLREGPSKCPHRALRLPLVRALPGPARIDLEAQGPRKDLVRPVEHGVTSGSRRHPRLEIVDPGPERHASVALEQCQVTRVPRQLALVPAHPAEPCPTVRQGPHQRLDPTSLRPDRGPHLEPVMLGLDPRRGLHPPQRPELRLPIPTIQVADHRSVAPRIAMVSHQNPVDLLRLARPSLPRQPPISQTLLDRQHRRLISVQRRRLHRPPIRLRLGPHLQPVPEGAFRYLELLCQLSDRCPSILHRSRHHHLLLGQLHALAPGRETLPGGDPPPRLPSRTQVRKTGCPQSSNLGVSPTWLDNSA